MRLLDQKADPNATTRYPTPGPIGAVRINPGAVGSSPLHLAALSGNTALVELLLERGANVDLVRSDGHSPLSLATRAGSLPVVETLVAAGADLKRVYRPSDLLVDTNDERRSTVSARGGQTLLHIAAAAGSYSVIPFLVERGIPLTQQNDRGETPLMLAESEERRRYERAVAEAMARKQTGLVAETGTIPRDTATTDAIKNLLAVKRVR
jgi:ankyrin repeat protein